MSDNEKKNLYIALGSNLGNCLQYLAKAREKIQQIVEDFTASSIITSLPQYVIDQPIFFNQVIKAKCSLEPFELLRILKDIEKDLGRIPTRPKGPRVIDLDIISYGDLLIDAPPLLFIPHPGLYERLFVLDPLFEIEPNWQCPRTKKMVDFYLNQQKLVSSSTLLP